MILFILIIICFSMTIGVLATFTWIFFVGTRKSYYKNDPNIPDFSKDEVYIIVEE